ncbi:hypothetical protein BDK51DRAFT_29407 [Blyttiomyces helicus]|uniref:Uncharacterized protein n=1 Tax=Blyttiomyces helicus TaxID=388810 RepID=A0A4P9WQ09_9FUNG|nr:hypothetical protein BDK51DRAFT_29407 [Blyttiomyces helicus]|eukprot:RKO94445.1 hypothetical protein BDK51DRAFT_29407 [Blyttiomyces helicus]
MHEVGGWGALVLFIFRTGSARETTAQKGDIWAVGCWFCSRETHNPFLSQHKSSQGGTGDGKDLNSGSFVKIQFSSIPEIPFNLTGDRKSYHNATLSGSGQTPHPRSNPALMQQLKRCLANAEGRSAQSQAFPVFGQLQLMYDVGVLDLLELDPDSDRSEIRALANDIGGGGGGGGAWFSFWDWSHLQILGQKKGSSVTYNFPKTFTRRQESPTVCPNSGDLQAQGRSDYVMRQGTGPWKGYQRELGTMGVQKDLINIGLGGTG